MIGNRTGAAARSKVCVVSKLGIAAQACHMLVGRLGICEQMRVSKLVGLNFFLRKLVNTSGIYAEMVASSLRSVTKSNNLFVES